ncbi:MAG: YgjV family protein [Bacilli bacterium]|nr:YgjV family protein [Bacilli bacterium]
MVYWVAQCFGVLGLLVMIISLFQKNKDKMLWYVVFNGIFFGIEYLLLGAYSGMFSNFFGIFRTYVSKEKEKNEKLNKLYVLLFFIIGYTIIGFISFDGKIISVLPIIAEIIYVVTLWQKDVKKIRLGTLLMVILWLIYDIFVKAYPSMITDLIVMFSTIVAIIIKDILKRKEVK